MIKQDLTDFQRSYYFDRVLSTYRTDHEDAEVAHRNEMLQEMTRVGLMTHGSGGKLVEPLIRKELGFFEYGDSIHDFDGITSGGKLVEIKMETVSNTPLNANGSFAEHRENSDKRKDSLYLEYRPYIVHCGTCNVTGKCLYVLSVDTAKLPDDAPLFERLSVRSPRISFAHVKDYPEALKLHFMNEPLLAAVTENGKAEVINKGFYEALYNMYINDSVTPCIDRSHGNRRTPPVGYKAPTRTKSTVVNTGAVDYVARNIANCEFIQQNTDILPTSKYALNEIFRIVRDFGEDTMVEAIDSGLIDKNSSGDYIRLEVRPSLEKNEKSALRMVANNV